MLKRLILYTICSALSFSVFAQEESVGINEQCETVDSVFLAQIDSMLAVAQDRQVVDDALARASKRQMKRELGFDYECVTPLLGSLIVTASDKGFRNHAGTFPETKGLYRWTDYGVAGAPLATAWVMKMAGVKSRSKWSRFVTANAMSLAIAAGASEGLKRCVSEPRPDGSGNDAFPSGHATIAYVSATVLAREYGYLSPWIPVGGYACATATEMLRMGHNKHWMNDLYMGAGIGILSTNLGYFLTDLCFKEKGILVPPCASRKDIERIIRFNYQPSGLAFISGTEFGSGTFNVEGVPVKTAAAFTTGVDASWFFSPYFAGELLARATTGQTKVYNEKVSSLKDNVYSADNLQMYHLDFAAKASLPFLLSQRMSARAIAGVRRVEEMRFNSIDNGSPLRMPASTNFELGCGVALEAIDKENYAIGVNIDYVHAFAPVMKNRFNISSVWRIIF